MLDEALKHFFDDRKEAWMKKSVKSSMSENEIAEVKVKCENVFSLENWLPNAAKRSGQISMASHPCTFSHPSARKNKNGYVTPIIASAKKINDGFIRTGNVEVETDALGNAASLDVYKFLNLEMNDGKPLYDHIQCDTELSKSLLNIETMAYEDLKSGFLAMLLNSGTNVTSSKIKQVYFPVSNEYHLLSLISNSGIIYGFRENIDTIRFSDKTKKSRELKHAGKYDAAGYLELYNLTTIGYGGTKPQNISVLNNKYGGKAHLLLSAPPEIQKRKIRFPKRNFFGESFSLYDCKDILDALQKIMLTDYNNINIREGRDYRIQELIDRMLHRMWLVRSVSNEQFREAHSSLKQHQKTWLCESEKEQRELSDEWLENIINEMSTWVIRTYDQRFGKKAEKLGKDDRLHIRTIILKNKEALR